MTVYRNRSFAALMVVIAVVFAAGSAAAAAIRGSGWVAVGFVCALSIFVLLRLARAGVYAGEDGITIVNPLQTRRVAWGELLRFSLRPHGGFAAVGFAELRDGTRVQIWGLQARTSSTASKRIPQQIVDALNERLMSERARAPAPPPPR